MKTTMFVAAIALILHAAPVDAADVFTSQADFESAVLAAGGTLGSFEDFEEANATGAVFPAAQLTPPLQPGVLNVNADFVGFPTGLLAPNMQVTTSAGRITVLGDNFGSIGNSTEVVGAEIATEATIVEILPGGDAIEAIGLNVINPLGSGDYDVTVLDEGGAEVFAGIVSAGAADGSFIGVIVAAGESIGSFSVRGVDEGVFIDNIELWYLEDPTPTQESTWGAVKGIFR